MGPMNIAGIGVLCSQGRGLARLEQALHESVMSPEVSGSCHRIPIEALEDREVLWDIRRADRFSKIAVLAAHDAICDSGASNSSMGIIVCTALGPHATTFRFLDDILDYGDSSVSPTTFSHSIHNAAASYIAKVLKCTGPTLTVTQFHFAFQEALLLAGAWMAEGRCKRVLVGCVEECGQVLESIYSQSPQASACGCKTSVGLGEGGVFFLLTSDPAQGRYGAFSDISFNAELGVEERPDLCIMEGDRSADPAIPATGYAPIFGSMMTGSGFQCAVAALMLRNQVSYASPACNVFHVSNATAKTGPMNIREIHCVKYDFKGQKCCVKLKK